MKYFITTIRREESGKRKSRCWGYYSTKQAAERELKKAYAFFHEGLYYNFAVIEAIGEGCLSYDSKPTWFSLTSRAAKKIDAPKWAKQIVGWGIG